MIHEIDTATLRGWQEEGRDFILVDTLPAAAYADGHLPGAVHLMSDDVATRAPQRFPGRNATIVVYCASAQCKRAGLSARRLAKLGYSDVHHYVGGKKIWREAGLPLESDLQ
ncbi:rhodanese-like domain-containing protein [Halovulum marinum]|uniref:rhodanese-like domain-containing protein n=1 Tax=Halovulum marinum TaxID=2662447 RepID=UPI002D78847E|nr:rhodanese-like domain-containing protein [Halovulum marinum]